MRSALLAIAGCFLLTLPSLAADAVSGNLVTVNWLEKHLQNADVLILDASPAPVYAANHVPGAVNVDMLAYGRPEIPAAEMEKTFRSWGVSPGQSIVIYDQGGNMMATRVFFALYYYGFPAKDLFVLDGGFYKWQSVGLPVTKESSPAVKPALSPSPNSTRRRKRKRPKSSLPPATR